MRTVNELIEHMVNLVKTNPKIGDLSLIYAIDDEGNGYRKLIYLPSLAKSEDLNSHWIEDVETEITDEEYNYVLIN